MSNSDHKDQQPIVLDLVQDPMVADPHSPRVLGAAQLHSARPRILRKAIDATRESPANGGLEL